MATADTHVEPHDRPNGTTRSTTGCTRRRSSQELRAPLPRFVFPATVAFLAWYLLYVVMSNWAPDFMSTKVVGNINVALVFGLLQFVSTFVIAWIYARYMADPASTRLARRARGDPQ